MATRPIFIIASEEDGGFWSKIVVDDKNTGFAEGDDWTEFVTSCKSAVRSLIDTDFTLTIVSNNLKDEYASSAHTSHPENK